MSGGRRWAAPGLVVAGLAALCWLGVTLANGPAEGNDTPGYVRLADALAEGRVITSFRTPGYPLFLAGVGAAAAAAGVDGPAAVAVVQTLLLAGVGTWLVYVLAVQATERPAVAVLAALLYALDADLQQFGSALLTEALTVVLALATLWLRLRDHEWRRAAWGLALLALVRPNFAAFPLAFAVLDGLRVRRLGAVLEPLLPAVVVVAAWWALSLAAGADPFRPYRWFVPVHTFGTVYEAGLWRALPKGPDRRLVAQARAQGLDPYDAAEMLEREAGAGSMVRVARAAIRADPLGYLRARARLLRQAFRQSSWMRPELMRPAHPRPALLAAIGRWHHRYRNVLYASFPFFVVLLAAACWRGLGFPAATAPFRHVLGPFVVVLLVSTALSSLSNYDVGRLALAFHPVNALLWALAAAATAAGVGRWLEGWRAAARGAA